MYENKLQTFLPKLSINCKGRLLRFDLPVVMGVLNVTPDSFYANSRVNEHEQLLKQAEQMLRDGATLLDIGGYSNRPGASAISEEEELSRVIPAITYLNKYLPEALLSVDTFRARIAKESILAGAHLINDISAGEDDSSMLNTVGELNVPYIMMHKRGTPQTMQQHTQYADVTLDLIDYFKSKIAEARTAGITDIIIDPGFGFAKTTAQNYQLLKQLHLLHILELPVLVGVSRKSMIQAITQTDSAHALNGTSVVHTLALLNGAKLLRVHDVKEAVECINIVSATYGNVQLI